NLRMLAQNFWRVVLRVERQRDQPDVRGALRKGTQALAQIREFPIHQWTEIRKRTARIDEREHHNVAAQVGKPERFPVLAQKLKVWNELPEREPPRGLSQSRIPLREINDHRFGGRPPRDGEAHELVVGDRTLLPAHA